MKYSPIGATSALLLGLVGAAQAADAGCDRACLNEFVDQYLAALAAHDSSRLPLAKGARYTENGQTLQLGDGMWGPARGSFSSPQDLVDKPILNQALAPAERRSRDELITVANSYFEGLETATDKFTPFDKNCTRIENGVVTSNNPKGNPIAKMSCGEQFATGFSKIITHVRDRRFPVVDEERGLVYAMVRFDHAGRDKTTVWNDGATHPVNTPFDEPFSFLIGELFKIKEGKIDQIEALVLNVPYGMPAGWSK